jgi:hypothetical protein
MKTVVSILLTVGGAIAGAAANFFVWFAIAQTDPDPTVGGAYVAMAMLTELPAFLAGGVLGAFIASRL